MTATASTSIPKGVFIAAVVAYAILDGLFLVWSIRRGSVLGAVGAAWLASIVPIGLLAQFYENGRVSENRSLPYLLQHFHDQSFAFMFGDAIFLPFSAAMAAIAWRSIPKEGWRVSWQWTLASAIVGLLAGLAFRYLMDLPAYHKAGAMGSFYAPTKLVHDLAAYPVLFGGLFCVGVPLVRVVNAKFPFFHLYTAPYFWLMLAGIVVWYGLGLWHDSGMFGHAPLNPLKLHPNDWVWP